MSRLLPGHGRHSEHEPGRSELRRWTLAALFLVLVMGFTASVAPASAKAAVYLPSDVCNQLALEFKPTEWSRHCDETDRFSGLTWKRWGKKRAMATGEAILGCYVSPDCPSGSYPARLKAYRKRRCQTRPKRKQYTRVETSIRLPASTPWHSEGWNSYVVSLQADECVALMPSFEQGTGVFLARKPEIVHAPRSVCEGCISGRDFLTVKRWKRFGGRRGVARATYVWHKPDRSGFRKFPSRLVVRRIRQCTDFLLSYKYTRIRARFLRRVPPGMKEVIRTETLRYEC